MRVYSDDPFQVGSRFEVEMFLPSGKSLTCLTEVVWIRKLEGGDPAAYDVGLSFLQVPEGGRELLTEVLDCGSPIDEEL